MSPTQRTPIRLLSVILVMLALLSSATLPAIHHSRVQASSPVSASPKNKAKGSPNEIHALARSAYRQLPMRFERNDGQFNAQVKYAARGAGYALWLTGDQAVMALYRGRCNAAATVTRNPNEQATQHTPEATAAVIGMKLINANHTTSVMGEDELSGRSNYFIGNDPAKWLSGISSYSRVVYKGVYRGVDVMYYGNGRDLEYDFKLAPGANPARIGIGFEGAKRLHIDSNGELVIGTGMGDLRQHKPVAYQKSAGKRIEVRVRYVLRGKNAVLFALGQYDHRKPLVIDPVLAYSTYLGGRQSDSVNAIAVDAAGNAYATGGTGSGDFPVVNPIGSLNNGRYAFVSKFNPAGSALIYSTFISGAPNVLSNSSNGLGITLDAANSVYVTGETNGVSFPTTAGAFQPTNRGHNDAFALKLNAAGSALVYSTYLGGANDDSGKGIAVDAMGNAYVTGQTASSDFPTANAMQPAASGFRDAFLTKLNPTGTALVYSTFLGGSQIENGNSIAVDSSGNAYVTGGTTSEDFPTVNALQPGFRGRGAFSTADGGVNWTAVSNSFPFTTGVSAVAIDPFNSSTIYVGTGNRGPFKSTDGGNNWIAIHNGIPDVTARGYLGFYNLITHLEIDRNTPTTLFAGTFGSGVFKSTDGGNSWTAKNFGIVTSVEIDPLNSANVYLTDLGLGFNRSTDGGEHFAEYGNIPRQYDISTCAIAPTNPTTIYVGTYKGGMFRLGGNGDSQSLLGNPFNSVAVDPTNSATIYAAALSGMFRSTNSGDSWMQINNGLQVEGATQYMVSVAIDPQAPNTIYAGGIEFLFKSTNGGATWVRLPGLPTAYMFDIAIDTHATSHLYVGMNIVDDAFVSKLNAAGSALVYSTYIGGLDIDEGLGIAVDAARKVYVSGTSNSASISGVTSAFPRRGISDAFVMKLSAAGSLSYFTYIGGAGSEQGKSIAIDSAGNSYVAGNTTSSDFPTTAGSIPVGGGACPFCAHAFVTKLNQQGTALLYSSYLGGNDATAPVMGRENGNAIALDPASSIYVAGDAFSTNFPVTTGAFDQTFNGVIDGFVAKLNLFDVCMQDDTNGNLLRFNSATGDYLFANCRKAITYAGRGTVAINFCKITLGARTPDQTLTALSNSCTRAASAQLVAQGKSLTILDKDMANDSCACQ